MKIWESEYFALDFATGELGKAISPHYFSGVNFAQAQLSLIHSGKTWLRLTGNWFLENSNNTPQLTEGKEVDKVTDAYENLIDPRELVKDMSLDDFIDWLDIGTHEDVKAALNKFREYKMEDHVRVIIGHLKHKYNDDSYEGS